MLVCCLIIIWFVICGSQQSRPGRWLYRAHRWLSVSLFLFFLSITLCACMHVCVYLRKCLHSCVSLHVFVSKCECLCVVLGISTLWTIWYNTACWAKINPACKGSRDTSAHTFTQLAYSLYHVLVLYIEISLHLHVCCCITAIPNRPVLWSSVSLSARLALPSSFSQADLLSTCLPILVYIPWFPSFSKATCPQPSESSALSWVVTYKSGNIHSSHTSSGSHLICCFRKFCLFLSISLCLFLSLHLPDYVYLYHIKYQLFHFFLDLAKSN